MTTLERLTDELNTNVTTLLLQLADYHEDEGDLVFASGYRWLAKNNRYPYHTSKTVNNEFVRTWQWYGRDGYTLEDSDWCRDSDDLPREIIGRMSKEVIFCVFYNSCSEAFAAAAKVVGSVLCEKAELEIKLVK